MYRAPIAMVGAAAQHHTRACKRVRSKGVIVVSKHVLLDPVQPRHRDIALVMPKRGPRFWLVPAFLIALVAAVIASVVTNNHVSAGQGQLTSIYPTNTIPITQAEDDSRAVEVGVKFSVSTSGSIVGLRYFKSSRNTGSHVGTLWTNSGQRLAEATFTGESRSGWQTVQFTRPIPLAAGATYVASYHTDVGYYAQQQWAFQSGATLGNRTIKASSGVYVYGSGGFPTQTWRNAAYYVDVLFQPGAVAGGAVPPVQATQVTSAEASTSAKPTSSAPATTASTSTAPATTKPATSAPQTTSASNTVAPPPTNTGAFPNASNTGVPAGTVLTKRGGFTASTAGAVYQNLEINGCVTLTSGANNVTFRNVLFKSSGCFWLLLNDNGATGLQVIDSEFDGLGNSSGDAAIAGGNYTLTRVNIHGTVDGGKLGDNVTIQDSYIHDLDITNDSHNDGFQSLGSNGVRIVHNTIIVKSGSTSAIILSTGSADAMRNITIDSNLLGGGAYTVYGGYARGVDVLSRVSGIVISNNKFTTQIFSRSGAYGPLTSVDSPVVVTGNVWADGPNAGKAVTG